MGRGGSLRFLLLGIAGVFVFLAMQKMNGGGREQSDNRSAANLTWFPTARRQEDEKTCDIWTPLFHARRSVRTAARSLASSCSPRRSTSQERTAPRRLHDAGSGRRSRVPAAALHPLSRRRASGSQYTLERRLRHGRLLARALGRQELRVRLHGRQGRDSSNDRRHRSPVRTGSEERHQEPRPARHDAPGERVDNGRVAHESRGSGADVPRVSPYITHVECMPESGKAVRLLPTDFEPKKFADEAFAHSDLNPRGEWHAMAGKRPPSQPSRTPYFSSRDRAARGSLDAPVHAPGRAALGLPPAREGLRGSQRRRDVPRAARLASGKIGSNRTSPREYDVLTYAGPKERDVLEQGFGRRRASG